MIPLNLIFLITVSLINLLLGILVFLKGKKGVTTYSFFQLVIAIVIWSVLNYLCDEPSQINNALFWNKATIAAGFIQCIAALYFVLVFPEEKRIRISLPWKFSFFVYEGVALISLTTNLIVQDIEYFKWGTNIVGGKLYFLYFPLVLFAVGAIIFLLIKKYKEFKGEERNQVSYILTGTIIYLLVVTPLSVILPGITRSNEFAKFSPYAWVFFIGFTALAITRYHLFGIVVILTELLVGAIGIVLLIQIFMAPTLLWQIINGIVFALFILFGYYLIRATIREIQRREEVEKISKTKSEFLSIASHQLRTPLSAIKGYLSMVVEGTYGGIPERAKKAIENVYQSNERLVKLVNTFLDISRLEMGVVETNFEKCSIENIISETISELEIKAREKNLYLKFKKPKTPLPNILIDEEKIKEVILNLIDNAIKYTQKGGITIKTKIQNAKCQIQISDTGEGLTNEEKEKLFDSFSRGTA